MNHFKHYQAWLPGNMSQVFDGKVLFRGYKVNSEVNSEVNLEINDPEILM